MKKGTPRVSVIIASYNHEKYIAQAIESVLQQTFKDFEIVITDDGSSDATVAEIQKIQDPRIRLFCFETNQGACSAMNNCIVHASGEYVAVLNSDDFWIPRKLELQVDFLQQQNDIAAVFSNALFVDEKGQDIPQDKRPFFFHAFEQENRSQGQWLKRFFMEGNCLCHPSLLIKKECYDVLGLYDNRYRQLPDFDMWIRLCKKYKLHVMPETLVKFRLLPAEQNASNQMSNANRIRNINDFYFIMNRFFDGLPVDLFKDGFSEFVINPDFAGESEYECEKVFVYLACNMPWGSKCYKMIAFQKLYHMLADESFRIILKEKYSFDEKAFMALSATIDYLDPQVQCIPGKHHTVTEAVASSKGRDEIILDSVAQQTIGLRLIRKIKKTMVWSLRYAGAMIGRTASEDTVVNNDRDTKGSPTYQSSISHSFSSKKFCPICESTIQSYLPINEEYLQLVANNYFMYPLSDFETLSLDQYSCPHCWSFDRDRLCALYMDMKFKGIDKDKKYKFIEFAPSRALSQYLKKRAFLEYRSADLFMKEVDDKVDLMDMHQYSDDSVDMFCCSHVLEHVDDDLKAMRELYRILKKGGWGIVLVPVMLSIKDVLHDPNITTEADRWKHYGQNDHVRLYSRQGLVDRLEDSGFKVNQYDVNYFGSNLYESSGIDSRSVLYIVEK